MKTPHLFHVLILVGIAGTLPSYSQALSPDEIRRREIKSHLMTLRERCLYYAAGKAPSDPATISIRHGLFAQSPFSVPAEEIDLAATGFALAALPIAVEERLIPPHQAQAIALDAAIVLREMIMRSAGAVSGASIEKYGYAGMLYHYAVWDPGTSSFHGRHGSEISSVDTTLALWGLHVCAQYFADPALTKNYVDARGSIRWRDWIEAVDPKHLNQFAMCYVPGVGLDGHWDYYTQEVMLIVLMAAMGDKTLDVHKIWTAWRRDKKTYIPPGAPPVPYRCLATWNGDPFTVFYGQAFLDFKTLGDDLDKVNWFQEAEIAYRAAAAFFARERGYVDETVFTFFNGSVGVIAQPSGDPAPPLKRDDATVYGIAGGLSYYPADPLLNVPAVVLSDLSRLTPGFYDWHGWPAATVLATDPKHPVLDRRIVAQDIALTGIMIDHFLEHGRLHRWVSKDSELQRVLGILFPGWKTPSP